MFKCSRISFVFFILLILMVFKTKAQPALTYTQYMDNLVPINPASSLSNTDGTVHVMARNQWLGIKGAPFLFLFDGSTPLNNNASAGIIASDNELGVEQVTRFDGFFAKAIQLNETLNLGVSLNAGFRYYTTNYAALDPNDPAIQNDVKDFKPNIGFGVILYSDDYYVGLSLPQITISNLGNSSFLDNNNFRNQYYLSAGFTTELDEDFKLKPATLLYYSRGVPFTANVSSKLYIKETLGLGLNYSTTKDVAALFSLDLDLFHVGYSYQFGTSSANIGQLSNATHEIMLTFILGKGNQVPINPGNR